MLIVSSGLDAMKVVVAVLTLYRSLLRLPACLRYACAVHQLGELLLIQLQLRFALFFLLLLDRSPQGLHEVRLHFYSQFVLVDHSHIGCPLGDSL